MKFDIGEIIRKRVITFPAHDKEPKKEPSGWGLFQPFTLSEEQFAENLEYRYPVFLRSENHAVLSAMVDRAIGAGLEAIEAGVWEVKLHATSISPVMRVQGKQQFEVRIIYIFRARRLPPIAPAEMPSGSIVEVPRELTPEDLSSKKANEEEK